LFHHIFSRSEFFSDSSLLIFLVLRKDIRGKISTYNKKSSKMKNRMSQNDTSSRTKWRENACVTHG
jgi:hypothetical protein